MPSWLMSDLTVADPFAALAMIAVFVAALRTLPNGRGGHEPVGRRRR